MKLYFSSEYSGKVVGEKITVFLNNILYKIDKDIADKTYGEDIVGLTAIPVILSEEFSDIPERRYVSWKNKISDVRLYIDHTAFEKGDFNTCTKLIYENCVESFKYVYERALKRKSDFCQHYERFIDDFTRLFDSYIASISKEQIEEFNNF